MLVVAAFYHFFDFPHYEAMRQPLLAEMKRLAIKGSLLIAAEGFNATISGSREAIDEYLAYLRRDIVKGDFEHKESISATHPFARSKVRLKKEIISLGVPASGTGAIGEYVSPQDWNRLIAEPGTIIIDARNSYEVHLGSFENAIDPDTRNFKQLPDFVRKQLDPERDKDKKIATYCTGGIRCEKFTHWLRSQGFNHVYHLKGGILKYLEEIPPEESKWQGECYVFDERVAVGHGLAPSSTASMCKACGHALTAQDREHEHYQENRQCGFCYNVPSA